jgi:cytochrome c-type biogenesis protein CcmH
MASEKTRTAAVAAFLGLWVIGVGIKVYLARNPEPSSVVRIAQSISPSDWDPTGQPRRAETQAAGIETATQVAPIPSLLSGLEARLAANPNDANGWALLAQSYAFVGEFAKAEEAQARAVALGTDEQTLRERVNLAKRDPHPAGTWIERTIRE